MPERILIVRTAAIGDIVMTSVLLSRIRAERPHAHVSWLCGESVAELVALLGVDETIVVDDRLLARPTLMRLRIAGELWASLRRRPRFDLALIAHADRRYHAVVAAVRPREIRMLRRLVPRRTNPVPGRYAGDEYARLLDADERVTGPTPRRYEPIDVRAALGIPGGGDALRQPPRALLVPGGARNLLRENALRRWPVERYRAVAEALLARGYRVGIIGNAADAWVLPAFDGLAIERQIGTLSLTDVLRLMRDSQLVVSHDTGPLHLARLVRTPLVALFGPTMPTQFLVPDASTAVLWGGEHLACRPCYDGVEFAACANNLCMQDIPVTRVVSAAEQLLAGAHAAS